MSWRVRGREVLILLFYLTPNVGRDIIRSASVSEETLSEVILLSKSVIEYSVLGEVLRSNVSVINCHQASVLMRDFCRVDLRNPNNDQVIDVIAIFLYCIDNAHPKVVIINDSPIY